MVLPEYREESPWPNLLACNSAKERPMGRESIALRSNCMNAFISIRVR